MSAVVALALRRALSCFVVWSLVALWPLRTRAAESAACTVEGKVTFAGKGAGQTILEITAGGTRFNAELPDTIPLSLTLLLHSQVRVTGECTQTFSSDGYQSPARLRVEKPEDIHIVELAQKHWDAHGITTVSNARVAAPRWIRLRGNVRVSNGTPRTLRLRDGTGEVAVQLLPSLNALPAETVEVLGERAGTGANLHLINAVLRPVRSGEAALALPLLRTTEEVHALKPSDAKAQYPVRIRGVVTSRDRNGGMVQDATRGVYVYGLTNAADARELRVSDFIEVEGLTVQGSFAPMIHCRSARYLGPGRLPDPVRPTWERLNNGSLDCQFVEIEGFVTEAYEQSLVLLMPEGHFGIALVPDAGVEPRAYHWTRYANRHVRIRGTVFATRDNQTQRVLAGSIGMGNPVIGLGEPVLTVKKQIGELLQFDARAAGFHRVKVSGQVLHARERDHYLSDGTNSLRFVTRTAADIAPGEEVEVIGFPRIAGGAPVLLEAQVQRRGRAALPTGRTFTAEALSRAHVGARVQLEAQLLGVRTNRSDVMLDLQAGARSLTARLERRNGEFEPVPMGSLLRLTGVYAGHPRDRVTGAEADSAELLLNTPADIHVLERPSWWTPVRALTVVSSLLGVLALSGIWVMSLRRQVETRTEQLKEQILGREHAERQHLLEAERSRLARDLHDELGTSLTEVSLLANVGAGTPPTLEKAADRFHLIADKAARVIDALDVIVWAVNPATDALQPMADYITSFVREFLSAAGIRCRLKVPIQFPNITLDSQTRHNLFMAVKEALNNAARHSSATEIEFKMAVVDGCLHIAIVDNGVGFDTRSTSAGMGLANLRRRLERIGGHCHIESVRGSGTAVTMYLPLPATATASAGSADFQSAVTQACSLPTVEVPDSRYEPDNDHRPRGGQRHDAANAA
jgi:signal transduction histidine kinase